MTDPDYNRRMATALGWTTAGNAWVAPDGGVSGLQDYATDWRELPAILAALQERLGAVGVVIGDSAYVYAAGWQRGAKSEQPFAHNDTLLLAAGALLLRLTEEVTK